MSKFNAIVLSGVTLLASVIIGKVNYSTEANKQKLAEKQHDEQIALETQKMMLITRVNVVI